MDVEAATGRGYTKNKKNARQDPSVIKTSTWSPHVGVHRVAWHNGSGIGRAGWLASGGGSGLGRVEWVAGRFAKGVVPPIFKKGAKGKEAGENL
jgi:transcription factor C subunit 6